MFFTNRIAKSLGFNGGKLMIERKCDEMPEINGSAVSVELETLERKKQELLGNQSEFLRECHRAIEDFYGRQNKLYEAMSPEAHKALKAYQEAYQVVLRIQGGNHSAQDRELTEEEHDYWEMVNSAESNNCYLVDL
jgi:hypothetical protein